MDDMDIYRPVYHSARVLIGGMFIYTGIIHAFDPQGFAQAVRVYQFLPLWSVGPFALILPWVELLAGLALATGIWIRGGALAIIGMLAAFSIALAAALYRGLDIACGCFSTAPEAARITWLYLGRDLALLLVTAFISLAPEKRRETSTSRLERLLVPILTGLVVAVIFLFQGLTKDPCEKVTLESITRHKAYPSAAILAKRPVAGLCEVLLQTGTQVIPIYVGKDYLIAGDLYQTRKSLTREGFTRLTSQYFVALRGEADKAVAFGYRPKGPIRHTLYMFASPTCGHCEEVLTEIRPILDKNATELKVLFWAKGQAQDLAVMVVCRRVDLGAYLTKKWANDREAVCDQGQAVVMRSNALARRLGVTRVPTFFTEEGTMLVGAELPVLKSLLQDKDPSS